MTCVADWQDGYYMTLSPLIAKGQVTVGVSGGEYGIRGHITAVDAETGKISRKTHTIPAPGEPGSETWKGDAWKTGGASVWIAGILGIFAALKRKRDQLKEVDEAGI